MKNCGFTLAEVLITLAIIGVVAALTMPSLIQNVERQKVGPALAKAINTLENANKMILKDNDARSLLDVCSGVAAPKDPNTNAVYILCIEPYVNGVLADPEFIELTSLQGWKRRLVSTSNILNTKDGISYYTSLENTQSVNQVSSEKYYGGYYEVVIDINGHDAEPNEVGIDRFIVWVDFYGSVIPYGGREYMAYTGGDYVLWEPGCNDSETPSDTNSCAGSIVDNGFKVIYDY